jgi:hypothetical protein
MSATNVASPSENNNDIKGSSARTARNVASALSGPKAAKLLERRETRSVRGIARRHGETGIAGDVVPMIGMVRVAA